AEHFADCAEKERQLETRRSRRRSAYRKFSLDRARGGADHVVQPRLIENLCKQANKGNRRRERVANGRIAALSIPSVEPVGLEAQADNVVLALRERQRGGRDLNDVAASFRIEEIGSTELVRKGLAVAAITRHPIDRPRRRAGDDPSHLAATTAQFDWS